MSEFLRALFWLIIGCLGFCTLLTLLLIISMVVRGIRDANAGYSDDYVGTAYDPDGDILEGEDKDEDSETKGQDAVDSGGER